MACFEAFNNMCKKIVRPVRHQLNEDEMSITLPHYL